MERLGNIWDYIGLCGYLGAWGIGLRVWSAIEMVGFSRF